MSEKKPDTPVVHLPWSHYQIILDRLAGLARARAYLEDVMENGRANASDAAREALDLLYRDTPQAAPPPPAAAPDVIERVRACLQAIVLRCDLNADRGLTYAVSQAKDALRLLGDAP